MKGDLSGKHILIVTGSLLAESELRAAFAHQGARMTTTKNLVSAYGLLATKHFDGAVLDFGLHNEAFDLCTEFQALNIPYITANAPHRLQGLAAREADAASTVARLANLMALQHEDVFADDFGDFVPPDQIPPELRAL